MLNGKKILGVCVTRIHSILSTEYVKSLFEAASARGWKLIVFSSPADFTDNDRSEQGAKSIYDIINYDIIDALVICGTFFGDRELLNRIIDRAAEHNTPTVLLKAESDKCSCVIDDYSESFRQLLDHVISVHGAKDTFFIAGRSENDRDSVIRVSCYREVLESRGLTFSEDMVGYGEYWELPARGVIKRLLEKRSRPPQAVFCANDHMAFAVCEELEKQGWRVPEDVIVTGFDGVPEAELFSPALTTCAEDTAALADIVFDAIESGERRARYTSVFKPVYSASCGCTSCKCFARERALKLFRALRDTASHEDYIHEQLDKMLAIRDLSEFLFTLPQWLLGRSYACINYDLGVKLEGREFVSDHISDTLDVIESVYRREPKNVLPMPLSQLIPDAEGWLERNTMYVLSPVSSSEDVYGYLAAETDDIAAAAHKINRTLKAVDISFGAIVSYYRQSIMLLGLKNASVTDYLTGLPNMQGLKQWFSVFAGYEKNHSRPVTVSVYNIYQYRQIYESYGFNESEVVVRTVAELLKQANRKNCFLARSSESEFVVFNYFEKQEDISPVINTSVRTFYDALDEYRKKQDYFFEVNAGCTELHAGWHGELDALIKMAIKEMYLNRMAAEAGEKAQEQPPSTDDKLRSFELLIEKNMFAYHFQPIVDVQSGEIYAYEALMRPDKALNMTPYDVIITARDHGRQYDVEKLTMFNVLRVMRKDLTSFAGRKVFVNSLPGYFLNKKDYGRFIDMYSDLLGQLVIEITEESTASDVELKTIKQMINGDTPIAIDDYGTGHSNIVNLLRYEPKIIKVDRYLITNIQNDSNKQMFFRSTVEFAAMNNILVLAEGVETSEELRCVISLGADLIQGYYTGRPAAEPLKELPADIAEEIRQAAQRAHRTDDKSSLSEKENNK